MEFSTLELIAFALIGASLVVKGFAFGALKNATLDASTRKKEYLKRDLLSYAFLLPAVAMLAYAWFM